MCFHIPAHKNTKSPAAQVPQHYDLGFCPFDLEAAQAAYEDAADRAMQAAEDRWVDQGCSNTFDCDDDYRIAL